MKSQLGKRWSMTVGLSLFSVAAFAACTAADAASGGDAGTDADGFTPEPDDGGDLGSSDDGGLGGSGSLPEEVEDDQSFKAPVVTGKYLWSANPVSGRIALINGETLAVQVASAGQNPTYFSAIPSDSDAPAAIVLNTGSNDASWFRLVDKQLVAQRIPTHQGANRWSVGKSGKWAVAFSVKENTQTLDATEGLQELTVLRLNDKTPEATRLTVGYRPSRVLVADGDERAVVVSEDGITLLTLGDEPSVSAWIELGAASGRDVSLTDDGEYALVRRAGDDQVEVFALDAPEDSEFLTFSGAVTDLDLNPNGRAVAVVRELSEVATFTFPDVLTSGVIDAVAFESETFGSAVLTPDGARAVLFTNAIANERITIVELEPGATFLDGRSLSTKNPVASLTTTPDGGHAVVVAGTEASATPSFAVVSLLEARFPRVVGTKTPVAQVALSNDAALVTASNGAAHFAYLVSLPGMSVTTIPLATEPISSGALHEVRLGFVAQAHPEGRITFLDLLTTEAKTLTGFELSAEVIDR